METQEREIATAPSTAKPGNGDGSKHSVKNLREMPGSTFNTATPQPVNPLAPLLAPQKPATPEFSIIICSPPKNDAKFAQVENVYKQVLAGEDYEIIRIPDAASMAQGYARGAEMARGRVLVFSHDDAAPVRPFGARLRAHLRRVDIVAGAGTDRLDGPAWFTAGPPHLFGQVLNNVPAPAGSPPFLLSVYGVPKRLVTGIQAFDGFWFAVNRDRIPYVGEMFDPEMCDGFHMYDVDFSYRAHRAGIHVGVATDLCLMHASTGGYADPKWKPAADKWWAKYGASVAYHKPDIGFQMAAVTGFDVNKMVAIMDRFVAATED